MCDFLGHHFGNDGQGWHHGVRQCLWPVEDDKVLSHYVIESHFFHEAHILVIMHCFLLVYFAFSYVLTMLLFV